MIKKKVIIAAGGTGGHLLPAQEIAKKLQEKEIEVLFVGSGLKENVYFDRKSFKFHEILAKTPFQKGLTRRLGALYARSYHRLWQFSCLSYFMRSKITKKTFHAL